MANNHGAGEGPSFDKDAYEAFAKLARQAPTFGATGATPTGEVSPDDEGAIQFSLGTSNGQVIVNFGKPVAWLGMSTHQAMALGQALMLQASEARIIGAKQDTQVEASAYRSMTSAHTNGLKPALASGEAEQISKGESNVD